ncbi:hypothetical protein WICPIJ_005061 [Wickerhamomyces pijperi]|uniref:Uncharacterized protein n=1 Tax=Wickerhamomyces pijperi TaxID=599730 RepID=A0A9P8TMA5_WICPI|nr:hypothetical protein WICPIJ_005061 [Wickerhamomyces pijperi]
MKVAATNPIMSPITPPPTARITVSLIGLESIVVNREEPLGFNVFVSDDDINLTRRDIITLSNTNHSFREFLYPYIFNEISLTWSMIDKIDEFQFKDFVESIAIVENNSEKEWGFRFEKFFNEFVNLKEIRLVLTQSSTPLKYNKLFDDRSKPLEKLTLQTKTNENSMFGMDHLNLIPNGIKELVLEGFTIQFDREEVHNFECLRKLTIIDCYWNYPFEFESFDNGVLESLVVIYYHQFVLSERFKEFTNNFHRSFRSLKFLKLVNNTEYKVNLPKSMVLDLKRLETVELENITCNA